MTHRLLRILKNIVVAPLILILLMTIACGASATPTPEAIAPSSAGEQTPTVRIQEIAVVTQIPTAIPTPVAAAGDSRSFSLLDRNAKQGGTLKVATIADTAHYDMMQSATTYTSEPMSQQYNGVLRYNPLDGGNTIIPDLAEDWTVSEDNLTWTFQLREGVKFHDGSIMTSGDVLASWNRILDPPEGVVSLRQDLLAPIVQGIEATDPLTFQVQLKQPSAFFLSAFAIEWNVIHPKKTLEENTFDLRRLKGGGPGTGAFKFVDFTQGETWETERHTEYFVEGLPYLDGVTIFSVQTAQRDALCIANQVDFCWNISPAAVAELKDIPATTAHIWQGVAANAMWFNIEKGAPWDDPRVRRAIHLVTDRWAIMEATEGLFGKAVVDWSPSEYGLPPLQTRCCWRHRALRSRKNADIAEAQGLDG